VFGFNPFTPLDLIHLPNVNEFIHKERVSKVDFVKKLHEKVKTQIHINLRDTQNKTIKGRKKTYLRKGIGFGFTCAKKNFLTKESPNSTPGVMVPYKSSRGSTIMHIS